MAVKEKPLHGGGLGPVVGGEDHLPVGSNTCNLQYEKEANAHSHFAYVDNWGPQFKYSTLKI